MNTRMRLFKWRAIARHIARTAPPGSAVERTAIQYRDGLDAALLTHHDDRAIPASILGRGSVSKRKPIDPAPEE